MKKTLLSLLLASVATTAFSATVYQSDNAKLTFGGEVRAHINFYNPENKVDGTLSSERNGRYHQVRTRVWLAGEINDGQGLKFGFFVRGNHSWVYNYKKETTYTSGVKSVSESRSHSRKGFELNNANAYLSYNNFGEVRYGKFAVLSDRKFGDDTWVLSNKDKDYNHLGFTASTAATSFDSSFQYTNKVGKVSFGASWGKTNTTSTTRLQQTAALVAYNFTDSSKLQAIYYNTDTKTRGGVVGTTSALDTFDLAWYQSFDNGLEYGTAFTYEHSKNYVSSSSTYNNGDAWSLAAKVSYTLNQYFAPYTGISYVHASHKYANKANTTKAHAVHFYLGASSTLVKYNSVNLVVFLEGSYVKGTKDVTTVSSGTTTKVQNDITATAVATGLRVRF
ncbi:hypothetical protein [Psittacicella gerlachiana]|uniref:Porin n=1 Tax=Psittacicella gerlachiana TaxID=2028574 RepID=A0A3A1YB03_9GAMM|nr:hypothetical protein [Psittacicella gerlachiana]RIY34711.1 hypothetical protein CKF59_05005 [Psittacicella gerlachiana]